MKKKRSERPSEKKLRRERKERRLRTAYNFELAITIGQLGGISGKLLELERLVTDRKLGARVRRSVTAVYRKSLTSIAAMQTFFK